MPLTEAQLLSQVQIVRNAAAVFCTDTITLRRKLPDVVIDGESVPQYANAVSLVCRVINRSGESRMSVASQYRLPKQNYYDTTFRIQLLYSTDISVGDRLEYTDSNKTYLLEVTFVPIQHTMMGAFIVGAEEII